MKIYKCIPCYEQNYIPIYSKAEISLADGLKMIQRRRPSALPIPAFMEILDQYAKECGTGDHDDSKKRSSESQSSASDRKRPRVGPPIGPSIGPARPQQNIKEIGPSLPPPAHTAKQIEPSLPPKQNEKTIGPSFSPSQQKKISDPPSLPPRKDDTSIGPSLPPAKEDKINGPSLPLPTKDKWIWSSLP